MTADLPTITRGGAVLSNDRDYRYVLYRVFDTSKPMLGFCGTNPSTADEHEDDNTIRVMLRRAIAWGYGSLLVVNCFAWRETDSTQLRDRILDGVDIVGPENNEHLRDVAQRVTASGGMMVAGWGKAGNLIGRGPRVLEILRAAGGQVYALKVNHDGSPQHPLYISMATKPVLL